MIPYQLSSLAPLVVKQYIIDRTKWVLSWLPISWIVRQYWKSSSFLWRQKNFYDDVIVIISRTSFSIFNFFFRFEQNMVLFQMVSQQIIQVQIQWQGLRHIMAHVPVDDLVPNFNQSEAEDLVSTKLAQMVGIKISSLINGTPVHMWIYFCRESVRRWPEDLLSSGELFPS